MSQKFPIFEISPEVPKESEAMGTKEKFWFHHEGLGSFLYKKARQNKDSLLSTNNLHLKLLLTAPG